MNHRHALASLLTATLGACAGLRIDDADGCAQACNNAYTCGLLPSSLGFAASAEAAEADCVRLCTQTPRDSDGAALLACLGDTTDPPADLVPWCDDETDDDYERGQLCARVATCITRTGTPDSALGDVELEVSLISITDFNANFPATDTLTAVQQLYADDPGLGDPGALQACQPALCGDTACARDDTSDLPCDDTMCRKNAPPLARTCSNLGATSIDLIVQQSGTAIASQTLSDETTTTPCKQSSQIFDSATYRLRTGPTRVYARVTGTLTAGELRQIPNFMVPADIPEDEPIDYCLRFTGMTLTARSGPGLALVPIGNIDDIVAANISPDPCN